MIRSYRGTKEKATRLYQQDAAILAESGYRPTAVDYSPGQWSGAAFLVSVVLGLIVIGIFMFAFMLIVKPAGSLTVTYSLTQTATPQVRAPAAMPAASPVLSDRLTQLAQARDQGLISSQEFDQKRAALLASF